MYILGIDPGTSCGWALFLDGKHVSSGVWDLKPKRFEGGGMRFLRMRSYLKQMHGNGMLSAIGYEEVRRHAGTTAAHIYGGIVGQIEAFCEEQSPKIPYKGIPVGSVKKRATGKGNANKDAMIDSAIKEFGFAIDDNHADALWIARCLSEELEGVAA